ncbi:MAG: YggS family pyridoxal phosphate-dependent enzyme [Chloroflexi bacterium]|nr:YggS family pyridoxal phosphate-dependent enzyme [Chloroflexota bacterium]
MTALNFSQQVAQIEANLANIKGRMEKAARKAGRDVNEIKLVAVTKLLPLETIKAGIAAGIRDFGENYPEQAVEKIQELASDESLAWHMIGHIQSRKASSVCAYFDWVHAVDRIKIARRLDRFCAETNRSMPVLIEVNVSGEESKHGFNAWDEHRWPDLLSEFKEITEFPHLQIQGLMSMPPFFDDPEKTRPFYQRLGRLQGFLRKELSEVSWDELSIGTSFDYEVAIEEGATIIRLGTTIFGSRPVNE